MEKVLYKYNPQQMTKEELFETFVGRKALFESLITRLKKERDKPHHQHILLKAPRGMGKTHLLSMVYFKVKDCPEISSFWIPVQFAEEEFGITDLKTFFARILEELSREDSSLAKDFPKDDYTTSYAFLIDYLKRKNKNVLILVDNFNLILSRFKTIEVRRLRDILMNDPYLLIYGGAISLFKEIRDEKEPFYRFFKIEEITELKEDEFERLLYLRFRLDGKDDVLNKFPQAILSSRLKALYQLTGGNPRLLLILYQFIIPGELKDIITYLKSILDEQSQYFLEKIHRLSPQQQVIIDAIAKDSLILSPKEISQKTGLLINTVTAQISRLMDDGYLTPIKFTRTKNLTGYELSEQIFRVWYQMRTGGRSEQRIQFLIIFLQIWFTKEELKTEIIRTERMASLPEREEKITYLKEALEGLARIDEKYTEKIDEVWEKIDAREFTSCLEILDEIMQDVRVSLETTASIWFSKGYIFVEMKDYTQAISCYQEAIKIKPDDKAWYNMGYAYDEMKDYTQAISCYQEAIKLKPDRYEAWYNMGNAYFEMKDYTHAISCYQEAIKLKPDFDAAWYNMGIAYDEMKDYTRAISCYPEAIKLKPDNDEAWYNMGIAYRQMKDYTRAIACYQKAIKIKPDKDKAWNNMGNAYDEMKDYTQAISCYQEAIKLKPDNDEAWYNMGNAYFEMKDYTRAISCYQKAIKIKPDYYNAWYNMGIAYRKMEDYTKAIAAYKEAIIFGLARFKEEDIEEFGQDFTNIFKGILKVKRYEDAYRLFQLCQEKASQSLLDVLYPMGKAIEYLYTRKSELIERQPMEFRKTIEEILREV